MKQSAAVTTVATHDCDTHSAAVLTSPSRCDIIRVATPRPQYGQVLLALEGCGVCGSNLPVWQGRNWFAYPLEPGAPGHEGWGYAAQVGEGVENVAAGQRVAALSYHAFAEYDIADATSVIPLPDDVAFPFPAEPIGCAVNVFRRSAVTRGQTVAIVGIGFLGAFLTQLCANAGARVIAISRRSFALDIARSFGAAHTISFDNAQTIITRVRDITDGRGCECVIEAVGESAALAVAAELTAVRARLVIAGYHQDGPRSVNMQLWNWRGLDVINAHERDPAVYMSGIREAVDAVRSGRLDPLPLYTHRFDLADLSSAFRMANERPVGFMKALVMV